MLATSTLLILINLSRTPNLPLRNDLILTKMAEERCIQMKEFSHDKYLSYYSKLMILYGYKINGENLARNFKDATSAFQALEASPGHYQNNHNQLFHNVGIASCKNKLGKVTVILFSN